MYKTVLFLLLFLALNFHFAYAQKIKEMKDHGKDYIIKQAIEFLNKQGVNTTEIAKKKANVMADEKFVFVNFYMGFKFQTKEKTYNTYTVYIGFSDNGTQVNYNDYDPTIRKYKLNIEDRKKIEFALNIDDYSKIIETGDSYEIKEKKEYFEVTYQSLDAAWSYQIDKKTKKIKELWHEHLIPPPADGFIEIK